MNEHYELASENFTNLHNYLFYKNMSIIYYVPEYCKKKYIYGRKIIFICLIECCGF